MTKKLNQYFLISLIMLSFSACKTISKPEISYVLHNKKELPAVNIALVLGGGGSKGIAHVGALSVMEKYHIPIDLIVGSSIGSAIGAFYADGQTTEEIKNKLMSLSKWDILDPSLFNAMKMLSEPVGPVAGKYYKNFIINNIKSQRIENLKIPLAIVTTDINNSELFIIQTGEIASAVLASSAIPPVFSAVNIYGKTLVDGGVMEPVPVRVAQKFHPKMIISVDISSPPPKLKVKNMLELLYKTSWIYYYELARMQSKLADIDIHPNLEGHGVFEDHKKLELFEAGKNAAMQQLPIILRKMQELNIKRTFPALQ